MLCYTPDLCKYHGWFGPDQWCRHPDHLEPIEPGRRFAIEAAGGKCRSLVDWEAKVLPDSEPPWPMPVDLYSLFENDESLPIGQENDEKSAKNDA